MIIAIGSEMVSINSVQAQAHFSTLEALTEKEKDLILEHKDKFNFVSKRIAAKNALFRALTSIVSEEFSYQAVELDRDMNGRPKFCFNDELDEFFHQYGISPHLSISDEGDLVLAVVFLRV